MNREDIIRMAREAGVSIRAHYDETGSTPQELECFFQAAYAAGAAAEREACAKVCDETLAQHYMKQTIPSKDEAMLLAACADCAAAIRSRGNQT